MVAIGQRVHVYRVLTTWVIGIPYIHLARDGVPAMCVGRNGVRVMIGMPTTGSMSGGLRNMCGRQGCVGLTATEQQHPPWLTLRQQTLEWPAGRADTVTRHIPLCHQPAGQDGAGRVRGGP